MDTLSLYDLTTLVSETIAEALPNQYWVEAELMSIQERNGHCFMQLVQKDLFGATPVAQAPAKCWRSQWVKVAAKFQKATGDLPRPGMQLLVKTKVEFHPTFGFSLIVNDIDPTFTIGDMARKRQEIIQTLKDEGVFDLQRELELPLFCQKIAVISSPGAAGYGDFCNQLANNEYGFKFDVTLFPAVMQGEQVEQSVCAALDAIYESLNSKTPFPSGEGGGEALFSCVVIIRGGGAVADMSGFDTLSLAENVANFPIPIITGIGHDRDESVLDMVSFQKVKTPTAAAAFLIDRLVDVLNRVEDAQNTILSSVSLRLERQKNKIESLVQRITSYCLVLKEKGNANLDRVEQRLVNALQQRLLRENHRLEMLDQRVKALDPKILLKRGYSMTMCDGKIVKDAKQLKEGQEIETVLAEGKVRSIVK